MNNNSIKKLNNLSSALYTRRLTTEAALVYNLQYQIIKEADAMDDIIAYFSDPNVLEYISLAIKLAAAIGVAFPGTNIASASLLKAASVVDFAAAAGYFKSGNWVNGCFSVMSGLLSVPAAWIDNVYRFMLNPKFIAAISKVKYLKGADDFIAMKIMDFTRATVPFLVDRIIQLLNAITASAMSLAPKIAGIAGLNVNDVSKKIAETMGAMSAEISTKLGSVV